MISRALLIAAALTISAAEAGTPDTTHCITTRACPPYGGAMRDQLPELYGDGVKLRLVAMPTSRPIYAVALTSTPGGWRVLYLKPQKFDGQSFPPPLTAPRCEAPISAHLAERIAGAWTRLLHDIVPYEQERIGTDGVTYEFSMTDNGHAISAEEWSPDDDTPAAILVSAASDMAAYCASARHRSSASDLSHAAIQLNDRLDAFDRAVALLPKTQK